MNPPASFAADFLTIAEAAELLRVHQRTLDNMAQDQSSAMAAGSSTSAMNCSLGRRNGKQGIRRSHAVRREFILAGFMLPSVIKASLRVIARG